MAELSHNDSIINVLTSTTIDTHLIRQYLVFIKLLAISSLRLQLHNLQTDVHNCTSFNE